MKLLDKHNYLISSIDIIMKSKILFWIDIEFIYFGIAKHVCQNYDCDAYAIIDVNEKAKKFLQNQSIVPFKKSWYYLDHIQVGKHNPDVNYLKDFEKKYGIKIWNLVLAERSFYNFNEFYKFNYNEILSIIEQECKFFESILNDIKPDFIIIKMTDWHHNQLFYELCKAMGIKILMTIPTRLGYRVIISEEISKLDSEINSTPNDLDINSSDKLQEYLNANNAFKQATRYTKDYRSFNWYKLKKSLQFFLDPFNSGYQMRYSNYKRSRMKIFKKQITLAIKRCIRESFINKNFINTIPNSSFIFFPMHFEPERTLSTDAPFFTNQLETITSIAKSLPIELKLVVKEHPVMKALGWRKISSYKQLLELPNVVIVHPSITPESLYKKCSLVITTTGTAGFEAAFYNKPTIVLADVVYSELGSVYRLRSIEELPTVIKTALNTKVESKDLINYIKKLEQNSFRFDTNKLATDFSSKYYYGGFLTDEEIPIEKIEQFLTDHEDDLRKSSMEHIKKINLINKS